MEIEWLDRGHIILHDKGKTLKVPGEILAEHDPDFVIYARSIRSWDDGTLLTEEEKADVLDDAVDTAAKHGYKFEIEWSV